MDFRFLIRSNASQDSTHPTQRRWGRHVSSGLRLDQSSPDTRHKIVGLHARLNFYSLPVAGPDQRLPCDPVKPTATEHARPDQSPKPWKEVVTAVSHSSSGDGEYRMDWVGLQ